MQIEAHCSFCENKYEKMKPPSENNEKKIIWEFNTEIIHKLYNFLFDYLPGFRIKRKALFVTLCDKTSLGILYIPSLNLYR